MIGVKRHKFDHTHINSTTMKMGYLVPGMIAECLPGDTWQGDTQLFVRVAPMLAPLMHRVNITAVTAYVPIRLIWPKFTTFITGGPNGDDDSVPPFIKIAPEQGTLADYFGLPLSENELEVSALPFRAYNLIYNWLFRDQDLQDEVPISLEDGEDTETSTDLLRGNWQKDYFTTARPFPQKGPGITIPLVGDGSIVADGPLTFRLKNPQHITTEAGSTQTTYNLSLTDYALAGTLGYYGVAQGVSASSAASAANTERSSAAGSLQNFAFIRPESSFSFDRSSGPFADFTSSPLEYTGGLSVGHPSQAGLGIDVNDLLESLAIQRYQTRRSLFGSRYEDLLHYWGLKTQDFRLQEPELVSVGRGRLQFSEVLQTAADANGDGVGAMSGHGVGAMRSGRFRYYCHEHGFLITILCVRPQAVYTQGLERMWFRKTRWDYWNPEFQHIGQQEVLNKEVYADGTDRDEEVFGYQNRFDEYRRGKNHVTGEFRTTLDFWNMARVFENRPALNSEFITCNPTDRIFQLSESLSDQLYCMINNKLLAKRLLSRNGNPM